MVMWCVRAVRCLVYENRFPTGLATSKDSARTCAELSLKRAVGKKAAVDLPVNGSAAKAEGTDPPSSRVQDQHGHHDGGARSCRSRATPQSGRIRSERIASRRFRRCCCAGIFDRHSDLRCRKETWTGFLAWAGLRKP